MATVSSQTVPKNDYPTADGKPMAETDLHRKLMLDLIGTLEKRFLNEPLVYVSGNLLLFYERGNKRRHVAPDVFVVKGVPKGLRDNYLVWEEGKAPQVVIELTSNTTRREDEKKKFELYRDILKVKEYFLFDPKGDYLRPPQQGYSLQKGQYVPIPLLNGRLPSKVLGLHLERDGFVLRLYDPMTGQWLATPEERATEAEERATEAEERATQAEEERLQERAENERLHRELERLRRKPS